MMGTAVYLPLVLPVIVALAARPVAARLPPGPATWLLTVSSVVLAAGTGAALGVLVIAGALHIPQVAALGHVSLRALRGGGLAGSIPVAVAAGLALLAAVAAALRAAWRRARALVAAGHAAACRVRRRIVLAAAVAAIAVTSVVAAGSAAADLHNVVETAQTALGHGTQR